MKLSSKEAHSLLELALTGAKKTVPGKLRRIYSTRKRPKAAQGELDALVDERGTRQLE